MNIFLLSPVLPVASGKVQRFNNKTPQLYCMHSKGSENSFKDFIFCTLKYVLGYILDVQEGRTEPWEIDTLFIVINERQMPALKMVIDSVQKSYVRLQLMS